jgi:hypothetical protein
MIEPPLSTMLDRTVTWLMKGNTVSWNPVVRHSLAKSALGESLTINTYALWNEETLIDFKVFFSRY